MPDCTSSQAPPDKRCIPSELLEELNRTVASVFERATSACDASSSLEQMDDIRTKLRDQLNTTLARPMRVRNSQLSLQNRLPSELWLEVWMRLPMDSRVAVSHVCSRWRDVIVQSPDIWCAIDCFAFTWTAPDGNSFRRSTIGLVPIALKRSQGLRLSLTFFLHHDIEPSHLDRFVKLLIPHAGAVVGIDLMCTIQQCQLLLDLLHPLPHIQWVVHGVPSFEPYIPAWPPVLALQDILSKLQLLVLPYQQPHGWPEAAYGYDSSFSAQPRFPALRKLCFSPSRDVDITSALRDCPLVTSLTLVLGKSFCVQGAHMDSPRLSSIQLTHLYLPDVLMERVAWVLSTLNISLRQHAVVSVTDDAPAFITDTEPPHATPLVRWTPTPSVTALSYEDSVLGATGRRFKAKQLYRRISGATKRIFRRKPADDAPSAADWRDLSPIPGPIPLAPAPVELQALGALFHDLAGPVDVLLICQTTCDAWETTYLGAALKATDDAGRARIAGLRYRGNVQTFLSCVWKADIPLANVSRLTTELELFPALVASLPNETPISNLELLLAHNELPEGMADNESVPALGEVLDGVALGTCERAVFSTLRTLRFGPRDVNSARRAVLHTQDIKTFLGTCGCHTPLESITLARGVDVDDASALGTLALTVIVGADPTHWDPYAL